MTRLLGLSMLVIAVGIGETTLWNSFSVTDGWYELATSTLTTSGYLAEAKSATETERKRVLSERDAFDRFTRVVETMSVSSGKQTAPMMLARDGNSDGQRLCTIRDAYRDTVMSVPHFEDEYDENLRENLSLEFDDQLATALVDSREFQPLLKQMVIVRAIEAKRSREKLLDGLEAELTSLGDARKRLREHEQSLEFAMEPKRKLRRRSEPTLLEYEASLCREEDRCEQLLADRQHEMHRENRSYSRSSKPTLQQYLYDDLDVTYPVLATVTERIEQLRAQRRAVHETILNRR